MEIEGLKFYPNEKEIILKRISKSSNRLVILQVNSHPDYQKFIKSLFASNDQTFRFLTYRKQSVIKHLPSIQTIYTLHRSFQIPFQTKVEDYLSDFKNEKYFDFNHFFQTFDIRYDSSKFLELVRNRDCFVFLDVHQIPVIYLLHSLAALEYAHSGTIRWFEENISKTYLRLNSKLNISQILSIYSNNPWLRENRKTLWFLGDFTSNDHHDLRKRHSSFFTPSLVDFKYLTDKVLYHTCFFDQLDNNKKSTLLHLHYGNWLFSDLVSSLTHDNALFKLFPGPSYEALPIFQAIESVIKPRIIRESSIDYCTMFLWPRIFHSSHLKSLYNQARNKLISSLLISSGRQIQEKSSNNYIIEEGGDSKIKLKSPWYMESENYIPLSAHFSTFSLYSTTMEITAISRSGVADEKITLPAGSVLLLVDIVGGDEVLSLKTLHVPPLIRRLMQTSKKGSLIDFIIDQVFKKNTYLSISKCTLNLKRTEKSSVDVLDYWPLINCDCLASEEFGGLGSPEFYLYSIGQVIPEPSQLLTLLSRFYMRTRNIDLTFLIDDPGIFPLILDYTGFCCSRSGVENEINEDSLVEILNAIKPCNLRELFAGWKEFFKGSDDESRFIEWVHRKVQDDRADASILAADNNRNV